MSNTELTDAIQGKIVHEYDGILEADNDLPRWWLGIFYGAVVFAVAYWLAYETTGLAAYPAAEYRDALAAASAGVEVTDETLTALVADRDTVERGHEVFTRNCVVCHGSRAEGNIGPNLTDGVWLHGGAPTDIHRTIREGVSTRGMPTWGPVLGEASVQAATAYVLSVRDTNVSGRAPEGQLWVPAIAPTEIAPAGDTHAEL